MRRLILFLLVLCAPAFARQRIFGFCEAGNATVTVGGQSSVPTYQQSYPSATVSVFATGTTNLSTIYSDNIGTVKANPFTMTPGDGYWFAYADNGRYDVKCSGTGIASPFTRGDYLANDPSIVTAVTPVTFSATPVFAAASSAIFSMTLTGNVTSSTITGSVNGQIIYFSLCQDGTGGRTFSWPASFLRPPAPSPVASSCTNSAFFYDGVNWRELLATGDALVAPGGGTFNGSFAGAPTFTGAVTTSGGLSSTTVAASGAVTGASLAATGAVSGASIAATGAVTGATETITSSGLFSNAGNNFYSQSLLNGCNPGTEFSAEQGGLFTTDSATGCITIPSSSTQFNSSAVSGYVNNSSTTTYGIAGYFSGRALAAATKINTLNSVLSDTAPFRVTGYGLNIGINFLNGSSCCGAVLIEGGSTVQPSGLRFSGIEFAPAGVGIKWKTFLHQQTAAGPYLLNLDDASPEALNVNVGSTGKRYLSVFDGGDADEGGLVMQSGTQTSPANGYFFQARNALGAVNTAYPILLNPLGGNVGVGVTNAIVALDVAGTIRVSSQLTSSVATGTAPLQVSSTTPVANLTAQFAQGTQMSATSAAFAPGLLAAGACSTQANTAVTSATTAMAAVVQPAADPGAGLSWSGIITAGNVAVRVCNTSTAGVTPSSTAYNIRVIQ